MFGRVSHFVWCVVVFGLMLGQSAPMTPEEAWVSHLAGSCGASILLFRALFFRNTWMTLVFLKWPLHRPFRWRLVVSDRIFGVSKSCTHFRWRESSIVRRSNSCRCLAVEWKTNLCKTHRKTSYNTTEFIADLEKSDTLKKVRTLSQCGE